MIYVSSRFSIPERVEMWRELRDRYGFPIISTWIDETEEYPDDVTELWTRIEHEVKRADRLIFYVEGADFPLKGALVEVGMALSVGKPVLVVAPRVVIEEKTGRPIGSWLHHPGVFIVPTLAEALTGRPWAEKS